MLNNIYKRRGLPQYKNIIELLKQRLKSDNYRTYKKFYIRDAISF